MRTRSGLVLSATLLTWLAPCSSSTGPSVGPAADVSIVSGAATKAAITWCKTLLPNVLPSLPALS
jgi:hypothetical protein